MSENRSFDELMARLRAGDQDAWNQLFQEFASRLIGLRSTTWIDVFAPR